MAKQKEIFVGVDWQTVRAAAEALGDSGLSVQGAIELLLARVARDKALPLEPPPSDEERERAAETRTPLSLERDFFFKADPRTFAKATRVLGTLGLSVDAAVRLTLTRVAKEGVLPFSPNAETVAAMEEAERGEVFTAGSVAELLADLNTDDDGR